MTSAPAKLTDSALPVACTLAADRGVSGWLHLYGSRACVCKRPDRKCDCASEYAQFLGTFSNASYLFSPCFRIRVRHFGFRHHRLRLLGAEKNTNHRVAFNMLSRRNCSSTVLQGWLPETIRSIGWLAVSRLSPRFRALPFQTCSPMGWSNVNLTGNLRTLTDTFFDWLFHGKKI